MIVQKEIVIKLEPNKHGNYPCPHCENTLTPILREWMRPPRVTDYVCHKCKVGFDIFRGDIYGKIIFM